MDKYLMISLLPSLVIVGAMIIGTGAAVKFIKGQMASDANKAEGRG